MAPTARAALQAAATAPVIAEVVQRRRTELTEQTRLHFAPELGALADDAADDLLAALDVLCQFEALEALLVDRHLSRARTRRSWCGRWAPCSARRRLARPVAAATAPPIPLPLGAPYVLTT